MKTIDELILEMLQIMRTKFDYDEKEEKQLAKKYKPLFELDKKRAAERTKAIAKGDTLEFKIPGLFLDKKGKIKPAAATLLTHVLRSFGYDEETGMIRKSYFDSVKVALEQLETEKNYMFKEYVEKGRLSASQLHNYWKKYLKEYGIEE